MPYHGRYFPPLIDGVASRARAEKPTTSDEIAARKSIEDWRVGYESVKSASDSILPSSFGKPVSSSVEAGYGKPGPRPRCKSRVHRRNVIEGRCRHQPHGSSAQL